MTTIAPTSRSALDAATSTYVSSSLRTSAPPPPNVQVSTLTTSSANLVLGLPPQPEVHARRHPLKRKWRSFVNFFALPIRSYYLEPPGLAYRNELRARQGHPGDDHDHHSFWPVPAYTDEVGDDEMILFKAKEEADTLAAMQLDQQRLATAAVQQTEQHTSSTSLSHASTDDEYEDQHVEQLASSLHWPLTPRQASTLSAFQRFATEPSPRYEISDPLDQAQSASSVPQQLHLRHRTCTRTRTNSNSASRPSLTNGVTMARHASTPLAPTIASISSSLPTPALSSHVLHRRRRAQSNAAARPTLAARNISEPLSWTLVRSQYSYPKRGPTPQQLAFLSSVESLGRFGVPHSPDAAPSPAYESSPSQGASDYGFPVTPAHAS